MDETSDVIKGISGQDNQLHVHDGVHTLKDEDPVPSSDDNGHPQTKVAETEQR